MSTEQSTWDDVRRLADELEVQVRLAEMDVRDRWHELEPRLEKLEHQIAHSGERAEEAVVHELEAMRDALRSLRDDLYMRARGDYVRGW